MSLSKPTTSLRSLALLALAATTSLVSAAPAKRQSAYSQISSWTGSDFFNHFSFFTDSDPTHGLVQYVDFDTANSNGYIGTASDGGAYIGVDHTNTAPNGRQSVRLISNQAFNAGSLAVIDLNHIPVQYGIWPAIWMLGNVGTWPQSGESDIIEYVHTTPYNQMTLHTAPGCNVDNQDGTGYQATLLDGNCNAGDGNAYTGCGEAAQNQNNVNGQQFPTAGTALNDAGGAVYVHEWQADHISVWQFPHGSEPADLLAGTPDPSSWTQLPLAKFSGGCDFSQSLYSMNMIINIDFCGDWAGNVWQSSGAADATGVSSCNDYVANNPSAFQDAYFDIASITMYSNNGQAVESKKRSAFGDFDQTVGNLTRFA